MVRGSKPTGCFLAVGGFKAPRSGGGVHGLLSILTSSSKVQRINP
jgi:hypothetical protein